MENKTVKAIVNANVVLENGIIWDGVILIAGERILRAGKAAEVEIPEGATVIQEETKRTEYAEFQYVKYLAAAPMDLRRMRPKAKRRR